VQGFIETDSATLNVTKARLAGIDKNTTKTREDRLLYLRALLVLERQLIPRDQLQRAGRIDYDHLFFMQHGEPHAFVLCFAWLARRTRCALAARFLQACLQRCHEINNLSFRALIGRK
jgi:hypothetical protein